jgi:hypothetical protein
LQTDPFIDAIRGELVFYVIVYAIGCFLKLEAAGNDDNDSMLRPPLVGAAFPGRFSRAHSRETQIKCAHGRLDASCGLACLFRRTESGTWHDNGCASGTEF